MSSKQNPYAYKNSVKRETSNDWNDWDGSRNKSSNKRTKTMEQLIKEELSKRPSSHSSHFDEAPPEKARKPQDKRITELLAEKLQLQLVLQGHRIQTTTTGTVPTPTVPPTSVPPMDGDLARVSLHKSFYVQGVKIGWPFPVVMPPQRQMALHLISALKNERHVVLESPTGTGKSAAILCSVLAWQRHFAKQNNKVPKIIYCSRTHSQVAQMIQSLRQTPYRPRMAVLGSRERLCINTTVLDSKGSNVNTECRVRVSNTDSMRKSLFSGRTQYDDNEPPTNLPQDTLASATTTVTTTNEVEGDDDEDGASNNNKACCSHYRQLGTDRTAQLVTQCMVPTCSTNEGGKRSKHGTHDVEDLVQFGKDPHRKRGVALYRKNNNGPFGMRLVEDRGKIVIQNILADSPAAANAMLQPNDEVLQINGVDIGTPKVDQVANRMAQTPADQPVMLDTTSQSDLVLRDYDDETSPHSPCPYYISRALAKHAELLFCPYNYVLDPNIRASLDISLDNAVVVLDEAHNVEDTLRESGSGKFGEFELADIVVMLQFYASAEKNHKTATEENKDVSECAHELLVLVEKLMLHLIESKTNFERAKAAKALADWKKFHTSDDTEFDMTLDGPTGHGVRGKAVGCQTYFDRLSLQSMNPQQMRKNFLALDGHVRGGDGRSNKQQDRFSNILDKLGELTNILSYAFENAPHYYIATVAKANGSLEFASGGLVSHQHQRRQPQRIALMPPRKHDSPSAALQVCRHCRGADGSYVSHGDFCNGVQPAWQGYLVVELLTPANLFAELREKCRTVVLASGSLAPIPSLCAELGLEGSQTTTASGVLTSNNSGMAASKSASKAAAKTSEDADDRLAKPRLQVKPQPLEANHVIDLEKQLLAVSLGYFPDGTPLTVNYSNYSKNDFIEKLGDAIATVIEAIPDGGVLVFLPSYSFLRKCMNKWNPNAGNNNNNGTWGRFQDASEIWDRLLASKGKVIVEPTGSQSKFELAKQEYADTIQTTGKCILFAVFRGKMSEGISFNDANARGVICVGIPYPNAYDRSIVTKKKYNDEQRKLERRTALLAGNDWYSQQAYRAIAQALGRCIRHAADYGTVVLMDSRHCDDGGPRDGSGVPRAHLKLPKWMRHHVKNLSKSAYDYNGDAVITGGWSGLQREMNRFFAQAPPHSRRVLEQQAQQLQRSQQQSQQQQTVFNSTTGHWTSPQSSSNSVAVTPQSPPSAPIDLTR